MVTDRYDVIVVGAGIAGLTAAATAARGGARVAIVEGRPPGGRASTDERDGFLFNRGPHALYRKAAGIEVLKRLGVGFTGSPPPVKHTMAWRDGELHPFPSGPGSMARTKLLGRAGKVGLTRFLAGLARPRAVRDPGLSRITADEWLAGTRLPNDAAEVVRALMRTTTYVAATDTVSADAVVDQLRLGVLGGVLYLDGGWATLVEGLLGAARAAGAHVVDEPATRIEPDRVVRTAARELAAGAVVVAAGTPAACALLLDETPAAWAGLGPEVAATCLDLGLRRPPAHGAILGVGRAYYCIDHSRSARLAPEGGRVVHAMRYLRHDEEVTPEESRSELRALAGSLGVEDGDIVVSRHLHRMVVAGAMPTPDQGGLGGRPPVAVADYPGVFVAGDWVGPVGLIGDAALASGEAAGAAAATHAAGTYDGLTAYSTGKPSTLAS